MRHPLTSVSRAALAGCCGVLAAAIGLGAGPGSAGAQSLAGACAPVGTPCPTAAGEGPTQPTATPTQPQPTPPQPTPVQPTPVQPTPVQPTAPTDPTQPTTSDVTIAAVLSQRAAALGLGPRTSILVRDLTTGRDVAGVHPGRALMPASTAKLVTAITALDTLGPETVFTTRTVATPRRDVIVLVAGGDPSLTSAGLTDLAVQTAADLRNRSVTSVALQVDDSLFPAPSSANGWPRATVPSQVSAVRALVVDQHRRLDTTLDAATAFAAKLTAAGVRVTRVSRHGAPGDARQLGSVDGDPVSEIVREMLLTSDNDIAEVLARQVAVASGRPASWSGAQAARADVLTRLGVDTGGMALYDASGLSRRDRVTARSFVSVLQAAADSGHAKVLSIVYGDDLPQAGVSGSLRPQRGRFVTAPSRCAAGMLWAKTGQLHDVTSLAGVTYGSDGRLKAFAIIVNGPKSTLAMRRKVDAIGATVTGCW